MKFIIDIPSKHPLSGGIQRMLEMQSVLKKYCECELHLPNEKLPLQYDFVITYSDNPNIDTLCDQAKQKNAKVIIYQLSYGMALEREKKVISHPDTIVCCSTYHLKKRIDKDINKKIYYIGHSQESTLQHFFPEDTWYNRKFDVAIMIHKSPDKKFKKAFEYCKSQDMKIVLFGSRNSGFNLDGSKEVVFNADVEQMRGIFSNSDKYLSLSQTEGLNRPGLEAMLCGCKPYIFDGCEIYKNDINCKFISGPEEIQANFKILEYNDIKRSLRKYTWDSVIEKLSKIIRVNFEKG